LVQGTFSEELTPLTGKKESVTGGQKNKQKRANDITDPTLDWG